jgi:hypothetical protein
MPTSRAATDDMAMRFLKQESLAKLETIKKRIEPEGVESLSTRSWRGKKRRATTRIASSDTVMFERHNERGSVSVVEEQRVESKLHVDNEQAHLLGVRLFSYYDLDTKSFEQMEWMIIHPNSLFMAVWNVLMCVFVMFCTLFIPWQWAFGYKTSFDGNFYSVFWHVVQPVWDIYFLIDIGIQFRSAYHEDGELVQCWRDIAVRYCKGWLLIDGMSSFSFLIALVGGIPGMRMLSNLRIMRLARLLKLLRLAKLKQALDQLDGLSVEMQFVSRIAKVGVLLLSYVLCSRAALVSHCC